MSLKSSSEWTSNPYFKSLLSIQLFVYITVFSSSALAWNTNKNKVSLIVGAGPTKPLVKKVEDHLRVTQEYKTIYGVQYERQMHNDFKKGLLVLSNGTIALTIGLEY